MPPPAEETTQAVALVPFRIVAIGYGGYRTKSLDADLFPCVKGGHGKGADTLRIR